MNILVVDDQIANVSVLRIALSRLGHSVVTARHGAEAIDVLRSTPVDVILTDWMMPELDGLGLIRRVRATPGLQPAIIVITALRSPEAEAKAMEAGADMFLVKPVSPMQISGHIEEITGKKDLQGRMRVHLQLRSEQARARNPKFPAIAFGAGTGGADAVCRIVEMMGRIPPAAFFIVLHGPGWAAEALAERLHTQLGNGAAMAVDGETIAPSKIYIAPGDRHMMIAPDGTAVRLEATPEENYHRPSIDPLFRSIAEVFGRCGTGIVLGGTGMDGYIGAGHIQVSHGTVIVQDPGETASSQMPQNIITLGLATQVLPLEKIGAEIIQQAERCARKKAEARLLYEAGARI